MRNKFYKIILLTIGLALFFVSNAHSSYTFTTIDYPGATRTEGYGINNSGMIVGFQDYAGFLYNGGSFNSIHFPGSYFTEAIGISNSGMIVGEYRNLSGNHGYLYDGNTYTTVDFPGHIYTVANGINNAGMIVGYGQDTFFGSGPSHGFLFNGSSFITIDVPGASSTTAQGINDAGTVVGWYSTGSDILNGFLYKGGSFTSFQFNFPGSLYALPLGINNSGLISGTAFYGPGYQNLGLIYDGKTFTTIQFPGATDTFVWGVNDIGQVLGTYWDDDNSEHGFVASPVPELSTMLLLGSGLVGLIGFRRKFKK
jgi:probable HAF family extracellular repeat protein